MLKKWLKKSVAVLMAVTMFVSMAGCNKEEEKKSETVKQDTKEMVYEASDFAIEGLEGQVTNVHVQNDKLYLITYDWTEPDLDFLKNAEEEDASGEETAEGEDTTEEAMEDDSASGEESEEENDASEEIAEDASGEATEDEGSDEEIDIDQLSEEEQEAYFEAVDNASFERLYSANVDGTGLKEIPYPVVDENQYMQSMAAGEDGTITFLMTSYDRDTEKNTYYIVKTDEQGQELLNEDVTKLLKMSEDSYVSKILQDAQGRIIVVMEQSVYILDENAKTAVEVKPEAESYMQGVAKTKDGQIVCGMSVWKEESETSSTKLQVLDVENKKWGDSYELDIAYLSGSESLMDGVDYDVYYSDDSGIYGYSLADKKAVKLLDYVASNITSDNTWGIRPLAKEQFIGTTYTEDGQSALTVYNKVDPASIVDKTVITFGAMWVDDTIKKQAIEFNKNNAKYQIEFIDYGSEEDPITKMNADIAAGNVPDIISLSMMPYRQYIAKGMLEDLTPYYEQDEEISPDDMIDSVLEAMKTDGKLYYISPSFGISTITARTSDVGNATGWTFDEMKAVLEKKGDGVRPFYSENKSDMLYSFLGNGLEDFVDWQTGECRFDSQDFKDILEICNSGTDDESNYSEDSPSMPTLVQEGKILFVEGWASFDEVQVYRKMFGEDITYIGYPNEEKQGSYFLFDNPLAIYSKSEVKEGAWEFIRSFMTKEYQGKGGNLYNNPTRQDCFDMTVKAKMATEEYTDEFGQEIYPMESSWGWDDFEVEIGPLSQEEVDAYVNLVNSTTKVSGNDDAIMEIVQEEAKTYFAGEKSLDEAVDIIQNRISTYVNENR